MHHTSTASTAAPPRFASHATEDVDEFASALSHFGIRNSQLTLGRFRGRVDLLELPGLKIFRKRTSKALLECGHGPAGWVSVAMPLYQSGEVYSNGAMVGPGQATLLNSGGELLLRSSEQLDLIAVSIGRRTLIDTLAPLDGALAERLERLSPAPLAVESALAGELARRLADTLDEGHGAAARWSCALAREGMVRELCLLTAAVLCGRDARHRPHDVRASRRQLVARATQYLERSWFEPVRIEQICRELSADRRTLQNAFQEILGISPNAFFKNVRLNRVHHDLKRRSGREEAIFEVATRWGFWHQSQFARDYRQAFGELPSETRKRACA